MFDHLFVVMGPIGTAMSLFGILLFVASGSVKPKGACATSRPRHI